MGVGLCMGVQIYMCFFPPFVPVFIIALSLIINLLIQ